jgi:DNA-binding transcriptional LysR family regulator
MNARFPRPAEDGAPVSLPRRSIPSIAGLIAFEATARHLSFSQAARDLALSQGAVSKRVRALEQTLGVALLHRSRHEVRLSETGERFLAEVRHLLAAFEATTQAYLAPAPAGAVVSVGLPRAVAAFWLLPRLLRLRARHPDLRVNLVALSGGERPAAPLDAVIEETAGPGAPGTLLLWHETLVPVAAPALAARAAAEGLGAIERLHLARRPDLWPRWAAAHRGPAGPDGGTHEGLALVIESAIHGHGAALAPETLAAGPIAEGRLARLDGGGLPTGIAMRFTPLGGRGGARAVGRLAAWLAEEAAA